MTDVVEINDIDQLRPYHLAWAALFADTTGATYFQTLEWLTAYWTHASAGQRLRVLVVRSDGRPIGIVPLVERTEWSRLGPIRVLTYPLDAWGSRFGPIGPSPTATLTLALRHLHTTPRTWDVFRPRWVDAERDRGRTARAMRLAGVPATVEADEPTSVIECDRFTGWEEYLASRSSKVRHEMRRKRRRLSRDHWVEHLRHRPESVRHGDGDPAWGLYERCVEVARRSWQHASGDGNTLCDEAVAPLLHESHERAALLGMVDMNVLTVDGQAAAFFYAYRCGGDVFGLRMGYDPAVADGAGAVLLSMVIEDSFARGDASIDLGAGTEPYKKRLRTTVVRTQRLTHVAPGAVRAQTLKLARRIANRLNQAA
ncbi:MAG: GNAT family N-acetyltransferase [Planctomycetota bacterium]